MSQPYPELQPQVHQFQKFLKMSSTRLRFTRLVALMGSFWRICMTHHMFITRQCCHERLVKGFCLIHTYFTRGPGWWLHTRISRCCISRKLEWCSSNLKPILGSHWCQYLWLYLSLKPMKIHEFWPPFMSQDHNPLNYPLINNILDPLLNSDMTI